MSREDPQLRIRLPVELKEKIEETAKANSRSMNAEIVQRLDASFLHDLPEDKLISAKEALGIISKAKDELANVIFKRTFAELNRRVRIGHKIFYVEVNDLDLEGLSDDDFVSVFQPTFDKLKSLGYSVPDDAWDVSSFLIEIPEDN
ncbi:Arc family DNA-binding protein [Morganella morganii subsp. morganii]|uniref:Arc family DNA-binding protein n=1 Tax=Morganella morganii TaxID=582 RepID=UPI001BD9D55C|nr:Arc family DNA-binding protein [Morganella morganii]MBT0366187.1 Arc family DNA-binding protein [Morganella morganii subsp. morganii]